MNNERQATKGVYITMVICPNCHTKNRDGATYCDNCGTLLHEDKGITEDGQIQIQNQQLKEQKVFAVLGWIFNILALIFVPILFGPLGIVMGYFHKKYHAKHANIIIGAGIICMMIGMILGAATAPVI